MYISTVPRSGVLPPPPIAGQNPYGDDAAAVGVTPVALPSGNKAALHNIDSSSVPQSGGDGGRELRHISDEPKWVHCRIQSIRSESSDTRVYRFEALAPLRDINASTRPNEHSWHVALRLDDPALGAAVERDYTPVSLLDEWAPRSHSASGDHISHVSLLIKHYRAGALTSRLWEMAVGDVVWISTGSTTLTTPGMEPESVVEMPPMFPTRASVSGAAIALVAGGTGVTPMIQLARWALGHSTAAALIPVSESSILQLPAAVYMLLSFHTPADVLAADKLNELAITEAATAARHGRASRLHVLVTYTRSATSSTLLESPGLGPWAAITRGRISSAMLASFLPQDVARVVVSGPQGMLDVVAQVMEAEGRGDHVVELEV